MSVPEVEEFAKLLMKYVRDQAIASCDMTRSPNCNSVAAKRWREKMKTAQCNDLLEEIIPDCVDETLFYLLHAIDEGLLQVYFKARSGEVINLVDAGDSEMAGWSVMGGAHGWRARFSKERHNDD